MIHNSRFVVLVLLVALTCLLWTTPASATFPGENGKLTFERSRIFTVNPNGSDLTPIQPEFGGIVGSEPAFSPDGRLIAFDHDRRTGRRASVGDLGHVEHRHEPAPGDARSPRAWRATTRIRSGLRTGSRSASSGTATSS